MTSFTKPEGVALVIGTHAARSFYSVSKQITNLKLAHVAALEHDASTTPQWNLKLGRTTAFAQTN
jgi:hypothetical protein